MTAMITIETDIPIIMILFFLRRLLFLLFGERKNDSFNRFESLNDMVLIFEKSII